MDLLLIALLLSVMVFVAWVAYNAGRSTGTRNYQGEVATLRAANRRLAHDKADLVEELAIVRRSTRAMGIVLPLRGERP